MVGTLSAELLGSLRIDYGSAVPADPERQNCSICPRYWYVDTIFPCDRCGSEFAFTAAEAERLRQALRDRIRP